MAAALGAGARLDARQPLALPGDEQVAARCARSRSAGRRRPRSSSTLRRDRGRGRSCRQRRQPREVGRQACCRVVAAREQDGGDDGATAPIAPSIHPADHRRLEAGPIDVRWRAPDERARRAGGGLGGDARLGGGEAGRGGAARDDALGLGRHGARGGGLRGAAEVAGGRVALVGVLGHRARRRRRRSSAGQPGAQRGRQRRRRGQLRPQLRLVALALERHPPGQRVVQHAAERVDVGAGVDVAAADLLRRDVVERADPVARARSGWCRVRTCLASPKSVR